MVSPYLGFPYFALVALFYRQTNGFNEQETDFYLIWKTLPVLLLSILCYLIGSDTGLQGRQQTYTATALLFGALGDYSIGEYGLQVGASFFLVGHIFYLLTFASRVTKINCLVGSIIAVTGAATVYLILWPIVFEQPLAFTIFTIYAFVLSVCVILSASLLIHGGINEKPMQLNNLIRFLGFILFYGSDAVLGITTLAFSIHYAREIILFTYFGAQYLILWGTSITSREMIIAKKLRSE